ncbi:MAG: HAD family hydrolase [Chloroflexota bacterium]
MALRAVIFDYGHTFLDFGLAEDELLACYEEVHGMLAQHGGPDMPPADDLFRDVSRHIEAEVRDSYDRRDLAEADLVALYERRFSRFGWNVPEPLVRQIVEMEHQALSQNLIVEQANIDVLKDLRARGLKIGLISNAHYLGHMMRRDLERLGILSLVNEALISSEIGMRKPHPQVFLTVLERLGLDGREAIMVGDRLRDDIAGAKALGMRGILTREFRKEELGSYPIEPDLVVEKLPEIVPYIDSLLEAEQPDHPDNMRRHPGRS